MRNNQKITRIHLSVNEQDFPSIFGIVSTDPDYKLSLKLNKHLGISLKNSDPVTIAGEVEDLVFSRFIYTSEDSETKFQLISNRTGKNFLLRQLRNIDYLLMIQTHGDSVNKEFFLNRIRETDSVTGVFVFDSRDLKDKNSSYLF